MGNPLWERDGASGAVAALLAAARDGRGRVRFVDGEAGLGTSSLLESARALAAPGRRGGLGQSEAMEMSLPPNPTPSTT